MPSGNPDQHRKPARLFGDIDQRDRMDAAQMLAVGAAVGNLHLGVPGFQHADPRPDRSGVGHHEAEDLCEQPLAARQRA